MNIQWPVVLAVMYPRDLLLGLKRAWCQLPESAVSAIRVTSSCDVILEFALVAIGTDTFMYRALRNDFDYVTEMFYGQRL
jgi:hypothetical protein